ncbi:hypothetical protein GCM10009790_14660 [Georgenia ruanii]
MRRVVTGVAAVLLLAGCTGSAEADGGAGTASPTAAQTPERTVEEVTGAIFGAADAAEPIAEADGEIVDNGSGRTPARITVEAVTAGPESTLLRFTLYATSGEESVSLQAFNALTPLTADVRDVKIGDPASGTTYAPYLGYEDGAESDEASFCLCSAHPKTIDTDGVHLYATYPPLDPAAQTATVYVPGFPELSDVPVTRTAEQGGK